MRFSTMQDPSRACYGPKPVEVAHEQLAIQTLLLADELFSTMQDPSRACYGPKPIEVAHEQLAAQTLLLTDELFRFIAFLLVLPKQTYERERESVPVSYELRREEIEIYAEPRQP
uniref:Uncharacterized protein n=1 Tax=Quercus lobata TaxID=97700 RepID=A0A7N2LQ06_QUELO